MITKLKRKFILYKMCWVYKQKGLTYDDVIEQAEKIKNSVPIYRFTDAGVEYNEEQDSVIY